MDQEFIKNGAKVFNNYSRGKEGSHRVSHAENAATNVGKNFQRVALAFTAALTLWGMWKDIRKGNHKNY